MTTAPDRRYAESMKTTNYYIRVSLWDGKIENYFECTDGEWLTGPVAKYFTSFQEAKDIALEIVSSTYPTADVIKVVKTTRPLFKAKSKHND